MAKDEIYSFWYSEAHGKHFHDMNQLEHDEDEMICRNYVAIDGGLIPYTCCTTRPNAMEPYEGALKTFPDYKIVGTGSIKSVRTKGNW